MTVEKPNYPQPKELLTYFRIHGNHRITNQLSDHQYSKFLGYPPPRGQSQLEEAVGSLGGVITQKTPDNLPG